MRIARVFVEHSPYIFVIVIIVVLAFCIGAIASNGLLKGLELTASFLTGVASPSDKPAGFGGVGTFGAWATVFAGWLIIPTVIALLLGFGEKAIASDADLAAELFKFATRQGRRGKDRDDWVKRQLERRDEWMKGK